MRQFKFRAWNKKYKKWVNPIIDYANPPNLNDSIYMLQNENILMQYTGLKDKNGVEIYEGDVVQTNSGIGTINWYYGAASFSIYTSIAPVPMPIDDIEIIGNIYENPELT